MVTARGVAELSGTGNVDMIAGEFRTRGVEVDDIEGEKIVFLVAKGTIEEVRDGIEVLKGIPGVKDVHITYYSIENALNMPEEGHENQ